MAILANCSDHHQHYLLLEHYLRTQNHAHEQAYDAAPNLFWLPVLPSTVLLPCYAVVVGSVEAQPSLTAAPLAPVLWGHTSYGAALGAVVAGAGFLPAAAAGDRTDSRLVDGPAFAAPSSQFESKSLEKYNHTGCDSMRDIELGHILP